MQLEAVYQGDGILRLLQPVDLPEGERVLVSVTEVPLEDGDFLDEEYHHYCEQNADNNVTLEQVRAALSTIQGSMADDLIAEREERF